MVAGALARRLPSLLGRWVAALAGSAVILLGGIAQLAILNNSLSMAMSLGLHPFVPLDAVKAFVAALLVPKSSLRAPV
jgi:biotin transporter BioY